MKKLSDVSKFPIRCGTNISHWLSQSDARGEERKRRFTRADVEFLAEFGFDHLRLPVDEEQMWDKDMKKHSEAWDLLHEGLVWCKEYSLKAIVDLHILRCHHFNAEGGENTLFSDPEMSERFTQCWIDLSDELHGYRNDFLAYELMNEAVAEDSEDWNRTFIKPYRALREREAERFIAIGSNKWCMAKTFPELKVPHGDKHILLVLHYYNPMLITHYRASWTASIRDYKGPINYPGVSVDEKFLSGLEPGLKERIESMNKYYDETVMEEDIMPAINKAKELGLQLWCNEFGVNNKASDDIRKRWYRDFLSVLEKHSIAWSSWDFRGSFGLLDSESHPTAVAESLSEFIKRKR